MSGRIVGPEIEADDVDSLSIYTAGIPAEFGRKMGGVVEVNTLKDAKPGLHKNDRLSTRLQADVENLNNRLNVLDFGGLFSGNAIGPPRSYSLRLQTAF